HANLSKGSSLVRSGRVDSLTRLSSNTYPSLATCPPSNNPRTTQPPFCHHLLLLYHLLLLSLQSPISMNRVALPKSLAHRCRGIHLTTWKRFGKRCESQVQGVGPLGSLLKSRSVIRFRGPDTLKFLQGLLSNDVRRLGDPIGDKTENLPTPNVPSTSVPPIYAALLTPQGRFLYDLFLYKPPTRDTKLDNTGSAPESNSDRPFHLFADVDASVLDELLQTFNNEDCGSRLLYAVRFGYQALILVGIQYPKGLHHHEGAVNQVSIHMSILPWKKKGSSSSLPRVKMPQLFTSVLFKPKGCCRYRLRSKVDIDDVSSDFSCWQRYGAGLSEKSSQVEEPEAASVGWGAGVDSTAMSSSHGSDSGWQWFKDPRLTSLGFRGIFPSNITPPLIEVDKETDEQNFLMWRIEKGVAEGSTEIPKGEAVPLEYNLAGLNAVSFDKGCYVGQELIARTHHRGVIRKRIVPLRFLDNDGKELVSKVIPGSEVINKTSGKKAGTVTTVLGCRGLGLLRLEEALKGSSALSIQGQEDVKVVASRPDWWPSEWLQDHGQHAAFA
ncbi:hypothetical protein V8G54_014761, partial [Vigna mungo]